MNVSVKYYDGGIEKALDLTIDSLRDLTPIFKIFLRWLRPEIKKVFDEQGPGWAPLKDSTKANRAKEMPRVAAKIRARSINNLGRSVKRSFDRANDRLGKTASDSPLLARRQKAVEKHRALGLDVANVMAGGASPTGKGKAAIAKRIEKYQGRANDRISALERGEVLGRIANSIKGEISKGRLTLESVIKWAGVHNDGGVAGKGANIPKRTFLEWTPERIEKFIEIAQVYVLAKLNDGVNSK